MTITTAVILSGDQKTCRRILTALKKFVKLSFTEDTDVLDVFGLPPCDPATVAYGMAQYELVPDLQAFLGQFRIKSLWFHLLNADLSNMEPGLIGTSFYPLLANEIDNQVAILYSVLLNEVQRGLDW